VLDSLEVNEFEEPVILKRPKRLMIEDE